ncbi:unnamed protein product [Vicia faba]|uniref:RING-type E3 ubiquitin transferase n=1 Tax=Vicia faba TaxID=3906 RepID=A0AAV0Z8P1_VICFA|nr:unnamed protein product [Vicia faba]
MVEERVEFTLNVSKGQSRKPTYSLDIFELDVSAILRKHSNPQSQIMNVSTMFRKLMFINCEHFFKSNQYLLWFHLHRIISSFHYFTFENLSQLTRNLVPQVKELFNISNQFVGLEEPVSNDYLEKVIPVIVNIFVDVYPREERRNQEMIEESLQFVKMIPASNEAILSLKPYSLPRNCSICLKKFHDDLEEDGDSDDVKVSTMACGHIFHYNCIVQWLQTSHVCPLCRYAMPT